MISVDPARAAERLQAMRTGQPRVHCLTNSVSQAFTANILLAVGAVPSMSADESEVGEFVAGADALLVNLGVLDPAMRAAIDVAMQVASANGLPIVIDPVFADRSTERTAYARTLIGRHPTAIRCNRGEAETIGEKHIGAARQTGTVVSISGPVDRILTVDRQADIRGGHAFMEQVTAMGCALGAVQAALLAKAADPFEAVCAACLLFKRAGQVAGANSIGPGSFVPQFLDVLYTSDEALLSCSATDHQGGL